MKANRMDLTKLVNSEWTLPNWSNKDIHFSVYSGSLTRLQVPPPSKLARCCRQDAERSAEVRRGAERRGEERRGAERRGEEMRGGAERSEER
jgi:hypothetical protein